MMRSDTQFREEILRRKTALLRRRRRTVSALSATAACVLLLGAFWLLPPTADRFNGEKAPEAGDVIVYIYVGDRTVADGDAVAIRMEALGKYAPLPEDDRDAVFDNYENDKIVSSGTSADASHDVAPETFPATDDASKGSDQYFVSTGFPNPVAPDGRECIFTVVVGNVSKTYRLKEYAVTVDKTEYPLTEAQFEELWALFGEEE